MPTVFQTFSKKSGKPHPRWRFKYQDWTGKRKTATGAATKSETIKLANQIQAEHDAIRKGWRPPPKPSDQPRRFEEVRDEYLAWGAAQGGRGGRPWGEDHLRLKRARLIYLEKRLGLENLADLIGCFAEVEKVLRALQDAGRAGKTVQNYAEALASLSDWAVRREYLEVDPLKGLRYFDTTPLTRRRALSEPEIEALLAHAPFERRLIYCTAIETGLRANELRSLRVHHLDAQQMSLRLDAAWTKNRKGGNQPISNVLAMALSDAAAEKDRHEPLLRMVRNPSNALRRDLQAAGIPRITAEGKVDFHALRVTFITRIIEAGANVKEAQSLARHATPDMTMNTYARTRPERLAALIDGLRLAEVGRNECPTSVQRSARFEDGRLQLADQEGGYQQEAGPQGGGSNPSVSGFSGCIKCGQIRTQLVTQQDVMSIGNVQLRTLGGIQGTSLGRSDCPTAVQQLVERWPSLSPNVRAQILGLADILQETPAISGFSGFAA